MFLEMDTLIKTSPDYEHGVVPLAVGNNIIHLKRVQKPKMLQWKTQDASGGGATYFIRGHYQEGMFPDNDKYEITYGHTKGGSWGDIGVSLQSNYGGGLIDIGDGYFVIDGVATSAGAGTTLEYWVSYGDESSLSDGFIKGKSGIITLSDWEGTGTGSTVKITTGFTPKRLRWETRNGWTASLYYNVLWRWDYDFVPDYFMGQYSNSATQQAVGNTSYYYAGLKSVDSDGFTLSYYEPGTASTWNSPDIVWHAFPE